MHKYTNSQLPATINNYFKLITDIHPYDKDKSNSTICFGKTHLKTGDNMIKYSAIEIWSKILQK